MLDEAEEQAKTALDVSSQQELEAINTKPSTLNPQPSKLVLITGATSGIGRATAEIFARNGYRLILTGRRVERLVELKNQFESEFGTEVLLLPFDVRDHGAVEAALANLPQSFQDIDILINNAGLAKGLAPIHEGNLDHWETMIDTNVKGLLYVTRLVSAGMVRRRSGHIINIGSSAGKETYINGNVYCATKFAVDALSKAMRLDLHAHNIRVSQVSPGHVEETEFAITRFDGDAERAKIYNDFQPLKSSDVADAIYYMATRPPHVNIQDLQLFATQQASSTVIDRSGR
ncbi:MAG: SDR family NAD(P)-dependent oxidoreductase [Phycisphaerae bacterium]|nr:SDR family NAD(P)-dependent oxidoreductase [Saprospiraceae bacterium]